MTDYYQLLNLQPTATTSEIKTAYAHKRAKLSTSEAETEEQIAEQLSALDEAYAMLNDPNRRAAYDRSLHADSQAKALAIAEQPSAIVAPHAPPVPIVQQACPHCGALNPIQATMCSECGEQVSRPCPNCGQPVILGQTVCTRCDTFVPEYDKRRFAEAVSTEQRVQQERRASEARVAALEVVHRANARWGALFWLVVVALCIGLTVLAVFLSNYFAQNYQW